MLEGYLRSDWFAIISHTQTYSTIFNTLPVRELEYRFKYPRFVNDPNSLGIVPVITDYIEYNSSIYYVRLDYI